MRRLSSAVFRVAAALLVATITVCGAASISQAQDKIRIAFLVKNLGNRFFDAVRDGGTEAAKELGNVEIIWNAPASADLSARVERWASMTVWREPLDVVSFLSFTLALFWLRRSDDGVVRS